MIDNGTYDALIQIDLTQSVSATRAEAQCSVTYLPEPGALFLDELPLPPCPRSPCSNPSP
jgi:hypothetical protein